MAVPTYRILVIPGSNNSHAVDRSDTWVFKEGPSFPTVSEARQFVLDANKKVLPSQLHEKVRQGYATYAEVCLDVEYSKYHRHFLTPPDLPRLKKELQDDGTVVV